MIFDKVMIKKLKNGNLKFLPVHPLKIYYFTHLKTTLNAIISIFKSLLQNSVVNAVQEAQFYSIELETSLDNSVQDQCSLMVRYVDNQNVHERLLAFVPMEATTGKAFFETLENVSKTTGLNRANCVGGGSDGASNMIGIYKGSVLL